MISFHGIWLIYLDNPTTVPEAKSDFADIVLGLDLEAPTILDSKAWD
jgi:hypothetical protein